MNILVCLLTQACNFSFLVMISIFVTMNCNGVSIFVYAFVELFS